MPSACITALYTPLLDLSSWPWFNRWPPLNVFFLLLGLFKKSIFILWFIHWTIHLSWINMKVIFTEDYFVGICLQTNSNDLTGIQNFLHSHFSWKKPENCYKNNDTKIRIFFCLTKVFAYFLIHFLLRQTRSPPHS